VERAVGARRGAGCGPHAGPADRQADQCRISKRGVDAACQHHDTGTYDGFRIAFACALGCDAHAVTTVDGIGIAGRGQETADTKAGPYADAGSGYVSGAIPGASRVYRLIPASISWF